MSRANLQPSSCHRPIRRVRRAIASSLRLIDSSRRIVDAAECRGHRRPVRATRQLQQACGWLSDASARLNRAIGALCNVNESPHVVVNTTARCLDVVVRIVEVSERLDDTFARLLDSAVSGRIPAEAFVYRRPDAAVPRIPLGRLLVPKWPSCEHVPVITIHVRRRRSTPAIAAEPPRRISRGRAPPVSRLPLFS